jgi:hypothetical protein
MDTIIQPTRCKATANHSLPRNRRGHLIMRVAFVYEPFQVWDIGAKERRTQREPNRARSSAWLASQIGPTARIQGWLCGFEPCDRPRGPKRRILIITRQTELEGRQHAAHPDSGMGFSGPVEGDCSERKGQNHSSWKLDTRSQQHATDWQLARPVTAWSNVPQPQTPHCGRYNRPLATVTRGPGM